MNSKIPTSIKVSTILKFFQNITKELNISLSTPETYQEDGYTVIYWKFGRLYFSVDISCEENDSFWFHRTLKGESLAGSFNTKEEIVRQGFINFLEEIPKKL